ncbi:P-loop containing nucleoside triphosphate hydrolase protein [Mycena amicta]|nr:P-loop containing nucleoside triphosphate hydrolase protein [Mycena amicta]
MRPEYAESTRKQTGAGEGVHFVCPGAQGWWSTSKQWMSRRTGANGPPSPRNSFKDNSQATTLNKPNSQANNLNKQISGLWSTRRGKLNLNDVPEEQPVDSPPQSTGKRKVRSSNDPTQSKRPKLSGGAIPKDYTPPTARLADLGGIEGCIEKLLELVAMPLCHPEIYIHTGVPPPRGVLLHGPPGSGKTLLANAIAGELRVPFISISAPSIVSGMSGESEKTLRDTFEEARRVAPCLLFIDEIDAIAPKRESAQREMERRIVAQFLTCMDDMSWDKTDNKPVIVMGATNRPDSLDAALRRAGRFDHEISMGVPDEAARAKILQVLSSKLKLAGDFDFAALAKATPGYVGADLAALTGAAGVIAVKRIFKLLSDGTLMNPSPWSKNRMTLLLWRRSSISLSRLGPTASSIAHFLNAYPSPLTSEQLAPLLITSDDFVDALKHVQPSAQREGFANRMPFRWPLFSPLRRPLLFRSVGIAAPCGVLLWGPPGCGKTLLAKAVANESQANFISVKGPELLNKVLGVACVQVFARARASSPCVIFFDELDALSESSARVVNTLLTELDGLDPRKSVYVVAATNRPDMIDPAMVRPGRLDKLLYVDLPGPRERAEIVRTLLRGVPIADAVDMVEQLVHDKCDGYSGADLAALIREAGVSALRRTLGRPEDMDSQEVSVTVGPADFADAYEALRAKFAGLPVRVGKDEEHKRVDK